jgi:mannose-6-phosphate isomerase-like protein (cupin superfamily)
MPDLWSDNIERGTQRNKKFRKVMYTDKNLQIVYMSVNPRESIPWETHKNASQFVRVESGRGIVMTRRGRARLYAGKAFVIPPNRRHFVKNTGKNPLKLYSIYSPPQHRH